MKNPARRLPSILKYCKLKPGTRFLVPNCTEEFVKLADSNSVSNDTGKDAIFTLHQVCKPLGLQAGYYPIWNWL